MTTLLSRPHDPGAVLLRRGLIAGICGPALFALGLLLVDDGTFALFACFAAFAVSGLVWFGGPTAKRALAYVAFTATGAVLVLWGTALSNSVVGGMIAMLLVGFAVRFLGVFGGYVAAGGNAVLLAFVLPVMVEATPDQYPSRVGGWVVGCAVATVAILIVVPDRSREELRSGAAKICRDIAAVAEWDQAHAAAATGADDLLAMTGRAYDDVRGLRQHWASQPFRPAGPGLVDQAFLTITEALNRILPYLRRDIEQHQDAEVRAIAAPLRVAVADTLRGSADLLEGHEGDAHLTDLDDARLRYRETLRDWVDGHHVRSPASGDDEPVFDPAVVAGTTASASASTAAIVVDRVEEGFAALVVSHEALTIGANAMLMEKRPVIRDPKDLGPDVPEGGRSLLGTVERAKRTLRGHLKLNDLTFRMAVRTGVVLSLSVYLADVLGFGHKFWVVLGALTVLRTSASGTGTSGVQALAGTVVGFVLSGLLVQFTTDSPSWLWPALIISMFLAAYAPTAINFMIGQASFTLFVVVLFTIMQPAGWSTGIQRVEAMGTGIAVAVVGGVALWPRGAKAVVGRALASFYRATIRYLDAASFVFVHPGENGIEQVRKHAGDSRWSADDAFNGLVGEQRTDPAVLIAWIRLMCVPATARTVADSVSRLASLGYPCCDCPEAIDAMGAELDRVEATLERVASRLLHPEDTVPISWGSEILRARAQVVTCVAQQLEQPPDQRQPALGLVFMLESLYMLGDVLEHMRESLDLVCADLVTSAWR